MYGENPVFPNLYVKPNASKDSPELDNVKGAVFQVQIPFKYKVRSRLRKLKALVDGVEEM